MSYLSGRVTWVSDFYVTNMQMATLCIQKLTSWFYHFKFQIEPGTKRWLVLMLFAHDLTGAECVGADPLAERLVFLLLDVDFWILVEPPSAALHVFAPHPPAEAEPARALRLGHVSCLLPGVQHHPVRVEGPDVYTGNCSNLASAVGIQKTIVIVRICLNKSLSRLVPSGTWPASLSPGSCGSTRTPSTRSGSTSAPVSTGDVFAVVLPLLCFVARTN